MVDRLKSMLATAKNSVVVGFTATPLVQNEEGSFPNAKPLLDVIKGANSEGRLLDEGFTSYFMSTPTAVFPRVEPSSIPDDVPDKLFVKVPLQNFPTPSPTDPSPETTADGEKKKGGKKKESKVFGNLAAYQEEKSKKGESSAKLGMLCSLGQHYSSAGAMGGPIERIRGDEGKLLKQAFECVEPGPTGYVQERAYGFCTKLARVCDDLAEGKEKTLVLVHSHHGHKLLLRMLHTRFASAGRAIGYPPTKVNDKDDELRELLGQAHDAKAKLRGECKCNLCVFNSKDNLRGEKCRIMVADAKECSEGISFLGVRQMLVIDVPSSAIAYIQRIGRVVRFNGHGGLPVDERCVQMRFYVGCINPQSSEDLTKSFDEQLVDKLKESVKDYQTKLRKLECEAFDQGKWKNEGKPQDAPLEEEEDDEPLVVEEMPRPMEATLPKSAVLHTAKTLRDSNFKTLYNDAACRNPTCQDIWEAVFGLVKFYEPDEVVAKTFMRRLRAEPFMDEDVVTGKLEKKKYGDVKDPRQLAVFIWSSFLTCNGRELCSFLNQCIREDRVDDSELKAPLKHAVMLTRAINKVTVTASSSRQSKSTDVYGWPSGPNAELGKSDEADVTWRGGALPEEHVDFFSVGKQFRSNMFLATSFDKSVAVSDFMNKVKPKSRVVWKFQFEHLNCSHVNFLGGEEMQSAVKTEAEFLLAPYSIFEVVEVDKSVDVEAREHRITLRVFPDNKLKLDGLDDSESLPLAPWG